jgi:hypothetical protein
MVERIDPMMKFLRAEQRGAISKRSARAARRGCASARNGAAMLTLDPIGARPKDWGDPEL